MAMMHRDLVPLATATKEMAEKPKVGLNAQQSVGTLGPQATRTPGDGAALQKAHDMAMQERVRHLTEARQTPSSALTT